MGRAHPHTSASPAARVSAHRGRHQRADTAHTAEAFGAAHAFTDPRQLAESPDVDLVVISVPVPAHRELVTTALAAGKHVHCEWPLARPTGEAAALVGLAEDAGVHTSLGLQARFSPVIAHARQLVTVDTWARSWP